MHRWIPGAAAMQIIGNIEAFAGDHLIGWVHCPDEPGLRLLLQVEVDGKALAVGLANLDRQDVAEAGHGDGFCGFRIHVRLPPTGKVLVREMHSRQVVFDDITGPLDRDRQSSPHDSKPLIGPIHGHVDTVQGTTIRGWCWRPNNPEIRTTIEAWVDGTRVANANANEPRGDLIEAGMDDGDFAFTLHMPFWMLDGVERKVEIRSTDGTILDGSPIRFAALAQGPDPLLSQLAAAVHKPADVEAVRLLRCYLTQVARLIPHSVPFSQYVDWLEAVTTGTDRTSTIHPAFSAERPGLAAVAVRLTSAAGTQLVAMLDDGAIPLPGALERAAQVLLNSDADIIYGDAECLTPTGVIPWFRPDWNYDLHLSQDYTRGLILVRASVLTRVGAVGSVGDVRRRLLLLLDRERIRHLPEILCRLSRAEPVAEIELATRAVVEHLHQRGAEGGRLTYVDKAAGLRRIDWPIPTVPPLVSLIIPTRDRLDLVKAAVDSIRARTQGVPYEIIIVDNQSCQPETLEWLAEGAARSLFRVMPYDAPFNFSAMNNVAAEMARGTILGFINNDVELISSDWLLVATGLLARPEIGAVGARLRFANGMIQHAGVIVGTGGLAENAFQHVHVDDVGYFHRTRVAGNYSAVTAACLFCRRSDFLSVGGFDAANVPVAFNDVDFCLRLGERGQLIVWTPHIELFHHESVSRGRDTSPEKRARAMKEEHYMRDRWARIAMRDPHYSPNLNLDGKPFTGLALPPRHRWGNRN